jgi:hypothetical protein
MKRSGASYPLIAFDGCGESMLRSRCVGMAVNVKRCLSTVGHAGGCAPAPWPSVGRWAGCDSIKLSSLNTG